MLLTSSCSKVSTSTSGGQRRPGTIPGTLRYAEIEEPTSLNPLLSFTATSQDTLIFIFSYFYNLDDKMQPVLELITEMPTYENGGISKDGRTLTYHLRHDVKWSDGQPLTAHDVVFTTKAILNPANDLQTRTGWELIDKVEAPDPYTVRFHLKQVYASAIATFFAEGGYYAVLPAHILEKYPDLNRVPFNTNPVGSGPFKLAKWLHGDRIELAANPLYWRGAPKLQRIVERFVPAENTILTQMQTHEQDAWFRAPSGLYPEIQGLANYGYDIAKVPAMTYSHIDFNLKNPLFDDVKVRQAIAYAIDRQKIIHDITHDVHVVGYSVEPGLSWAYEPDVAHYDYDPAKSKQLLDEAGWTVGPDGIRTKGGQKLAFNLNTVSGSKVGEAIESLVQEELKAIGIQASIKNYPAALFFAPYGNNGILNRGNYDVAFYSWVAGDDPDNQSLYASNQVPPRGQNTMFFVDPIVDKAESDGLATFDRAARKKAYSTLQKELAAQAPTIVLYYWRNIMVTSTNFKNFKPAPAYTSNWNSWEWEMQ